MKWYQVVFAPDARPGCEDIRQRVQAESPERALRVVMREHRVAFAYGAFIWRLGRKGAPVVRPSFSCRLPAAC
jgi:hypothetical protein